ncbi:transmembrane protein 42 [Ceratina calcarata]|uniref:Transmembrane protein 42 n=1 Tax=Ceratina calcarata TaxID=156304 RepID=A0AAJ7ISQ5_9HYME|nr:transmembrane protein 42 [Ceratina calcarata]
MKRESSTNTSSSGESELSSESYGKGKEQGGQIRLAVLSGHFATAGSLFGKLAGNVVIDSVLGLSMKGILLILMITSNTIGCTFFVKALNASESSLPCTIVSAATSYVCSALVGSFVFNESTSLSWWCGISLVILGLILISRVPSKDVSGISSEKSKGE